MIDERRAYNFVQQTPRPESLPFTVYHLVRGGHITLEARKCQV